MSQIQNVADAVAAGKAKVVGGLVQEALDAGCDATELLNAMIDGRRTFQKERDLRSGNADCCKSHEERC